jgi:uncharacterized PurR-regulated membrane protein YhhQ (DUF165 family)
MLWLKAFGMAILVVLGISGTVMSIVLLFKYVSFGGILLIVGVIFFTLAFHGDLKKKHAKKPR